MREFAVVFWGGLVIGLGGVDFLGEVAEVVGLVVARYLAVVVFEPPLGGYCGWAGKLLKCCPQETQSLLLFLSSRRIKGKWNRPTI